MGFLKNLGRAVTQYVMDDRYESRRDEVPREVQRVTDRALVLARNGDLTPKKIGKLAAWDVEVLAWIGRERGVLLPGMPSEQKAINDAARTALTLAVEEEVRPKKSGRSNRTSQPPKLTRKPYSAMDNNDALWDEHGSALADQIHRLAHHDVVIIGPRSDPGCYVQLFETARFWSGNAQDQRPTVARRLWLRPKRWTFSEWAGAHPTSGQATSPTTGPSGSRASLLRRLRSDTSQGLTPAKLPASRCPP